MKSVMNFVKDYLMRNYIALQHILNYLYFALLPQIQRVLQLLPVRVYRLGRILFDWSCKNLNFGQQGLEMLHGVQFLDGLRNPLRMG